MLSPSRLNRCQNTRLTAFFNSTGFHPAILASGISLSSSKTGAVEVSASLIAILKLGILASPASWDLSRLRYRQMSYETVSNTHAHQRTVSLSHYPSGRMWANICSLSSYGVKEKWRPGFERLLPRQI